MEDRAYVGAYWGNRREELVGCADRLRRCLASLAQISPIELAHWKPQGRTHAEAVSGAEVAADKLEAALAGGADRRDSDDTVIDELGWSWSAWNGVSRSRVTVSVTCGATAASAGVLNSFVLRLPDPSDGAAQVLYERKTATEILMVISNAWDPDFGRFGSAGGVGG